MRKIILIILVAVAALNATGCATILNGTSQKISVSSSPDGAIVLVDEKNTYTTPVKLRLERRRDHLLVLSKDGYEEQTVKLTHVLSAAVCGNILLGGLLGWVFDIFAGTQYKLIPDKVHVELKKA